MSTAVMSRKGPPGPRGSWLMGSLVDFHERPLELMESNARLYGDTVRFRFVHLPCYQIIHPDDVYKLLVDTEDAYIKGLGQEGFRPLVGQGLLLNEGASHRQQRRMMAPAFHKQRIGRYAEQMIQLAEATRSGWQEGQRIDMADEMNRLTLLVATETLFGTDVTEAEIRGVQEAIKGFALWYHQTTHPLGPLLQHLPTRATRLMKSGKRQLRGLIERMIAKRRAEGDRGDILSMLVFARDAEGDGAAMSDSLLHDEAVTLLIAGHETTGSTLAWVWWLLAQNPRVEAKLHEELDRVLGGRTPTMEDVPKLKYVEWVFAEALRLYPAAMALVRQAVKPVELGGYQLPAGAIVMASAWCTHRDPRWWEAPLEFRPERWAPEVKATRPRFAYYPFGGGARVCMGEAFAWMEATLVISMLAQQWRAEPLPGFVAEPETLFTLRVKGGLPMTLHRRVG
ncbi:MAG: cytochrome P450 [Myxococcota bacterium]